MTWFLVVFFGPPAVFGVMVVVDDYLERRRAARDRHPSSGHIGPPEEWL